MNMDNLKRISHKMMIVICITMYIFGFIGNILNICVFFIWSYPPRRINGGQITTHRTGNSSLYLLTTSIANLILILYPLLIRILVDGYQYVVTENNVLVLCKLRYYILQTTLIISLVCICLATFDRYLITSRSVWLRQLSAKRSSTQKLILVIIFVSIVYSIPTAIYYEKSPRDDCVISSYSYSIYHLYFVNLFLYGTFPICFLSIFGYLTYKQIRILNPNLNLDKQLSQMLLFQCIFLIFSYIPYSIQHVYFSRFVENNLDLTSFNILFRMITILLFYMNPVASFYIYFFSTPNFRLQVKRIFLCQWEYFTKNIRIHAIHPIV